MADRNPHYRVAEGADAWALEAAVKALLDDGWTPQGGVCVVTTGVLDAGTKFYQAMVRDLKPVGPPMAVAAVPVPLPVPIADPATVPPVL